jgi:DNA-binding beta-propeller fold protein YncE
VIGLLAMALAGAVQPQTVLTIDPKHRIVEGVASDGRTIWVSSILDRQILACTSACRTIATLPAGLHPFAIAWDGAQKRLWVAADCPPGVKGITPCERGALIALDRTGRIRIRVAPPTGSFHSGDVSVSPAGVFVSDSQNGAVYFLARRAKSLIPVVKTGVGKSAQGTALSEDGRQLLVAAYSHGIGVVDVVTGARTILPRSNGKPLRGIDGVARCGSTYYGIYNGENPGTLVAIQPETNGLTLNQPLGDDGSLNDPTQIAYDGRRLLIVADSGWASLDKPDSARREGARVVAIPLSPDCHPSAPGE